MFTWHERIWKSNIIFSVVGWRWHQFGGEAWPGMFIRKHTKSKHGSRLNTFYTCPKRILLPTAQLWQECFECQARRLLLMALGGGTAQIPKPSAEWLTEKMWSRLVTPWRRDTDRNKGANYSDPWARICVLDKLGKGPWNKFANSFKDAAVSIRFCAEGGVLKKGSGCVLWPGQHRQMEIGFWLWQSTCWALAGQGLESRV